MDYLFQPGQRCAVIDEPRGLPHGYASRRGAVVEEMPYSGPPGANGIKAHRIRVKLDGVTRPLIFRHDNIVPSD